MYLHAYLKITTCIPKTDHFGGPITDHWSIYLGHIILIIEMERLNEKQRKGSAELMEKAITEVMAHRIGYLKASAKCFKYQRRLIDYIKKVQSGNSLFLNY